MKARARKALSLLLTLCMVIGLLPGMALTAAAAEATTENVEFVLVGSEELNKDYPYLVNGRGKWYAW